MEEIKEVDVWEKVIFKGKGQGIEPFETAALSSGSATEEVSAVPAGEEPAASEEAPAENPLAIRIDPMPVCYNRYTDLRDRAGLRDADVARAIGVTRSTFSDWKKGKSSPNVEKLLRLAVFFDTSIEYLVIGERWG